MHFININEHHMSTVCLCVSVLYVCISALCVCVCVCYEHRAHMRRVKDGGRHSVIYFPTVCVGPVTGGRPGCPPTPLTV